MSRVWPQDQQEMGWPGAPNDDAWPADHGWPSGAGEQAGADGSWSAGTARTADSGAWPAVDSWPEEQQTHGQQGHGQQGHGGAAGYGGPAGATGTDPYAPGTSSSWPDSSRSSGAADPYAADPYAAGTGSSGAGSGQADGAGSWYGAPVASDVTPSSPAAVPAAPARPAHGTVGSGSRGEPGGSPAGNGDGDDGMGWYRYLSGSGPAASGADWPGEDEAGDERSSRLSRRSRGERDQKPGARRGRRARPEPDSDPGAPAGTGFAGPGGTVSSPSGYGPGPAREIGEITAFQPPAPQAPAAFQPPAAPGPPSPSGHLPPGPFGEDRGFGLPDAPTGPQGFAGSGTRDRQDGASGWPSGGSTGISGEAPDAIWSTPANTEWPSGTAPSADTSPGAWPASQATDWPGAPASRHTAEGGRPAGWAQDSGATAAFDMPGSPGRPQAGLAARLRIPARPGPSMCPVRPRLASPTPRAAGVRRGGGTRTAAPLPTGSARLRTRARPPLPAVAPRLPHPASGLAPMVAGLAIRLRTLARRTLARLPPLTSLARLRTVSPTLRAAGVRRGGGTRTAAPLLTGSARPRTRVRPAAPGRRLCGCLTQRVAWRRWWPAWRSGSGLWRDRALRRSWLVRGRSV